VRHTVFTIAPIAGELSEEFASGCVDGSERDGLAGSSGTLSARLGILHLCRFAATHKATFGERPSETLARPRS
jgi:hypothetical protein